MRKIYVFSLLMALAVGLSVYFFADSLQREALAKAQANQSSVVVAMAFIPANAEITREMVALTDLPIEAINPLTARSLDDVIGAISQYPIEQQEQIFTTRIQKRGEAAEGRLSYILEPGYRAITIGVDEVTGIAGNITRGDYVDLIATMRFAEYEEDNDVAMLIVENLQVLATGKKVISNAESTVQEYLSVTLAARPEDTIKIHYAAQYGIRLALRPVLDDSITGETYYPTIFPTEAATVG
ncbi:MAG: Flp pilus assembly protein CpaB [Eubacteriales bacterium]|nr:Flp pilus assembly protein CpaB [Eubacteriales bacterium]